MKTYLIMAAGRSLSKNNHHNKADKRWNNYGGTTKHLVKIDGETILERTVRLIHQFEFDEHDVYIIARSSNYHVPNSKLFLIPENDDIFSLCGRFLQKNTKKAPGFSRGDELVIVV